MRKDSKDLVLHVCGKRGARHRGGCVGCLMVLSDCADPMASEDDDCEVGSVRYCREVLGLSNEGFDPRAKEIDRMVPKEEVIRVFGSKSSGKRNLRIENCMGRDGNPDLELMEFAGELHKKVYRTCKSKDISVAFGRGVLAERKGARIDWATFASKTQAKQMKMAASWAERHPGEVVSGRDASGKDASGKDASGNVTREVESKGHREEEVSSCDKELISPAVCDVVSMDVEKSPAVEEQVTWQHHHATSDSERVMEDAREDIDKPHVADDDIWDNNRIEEIEEQLKRVDMQRKQWHEDYVKVLQSSLQSLQNDRGVAEREMLDVTAKLKDGRAKLAEIQKRIVSVKESLEQNRQDKTVHEDRLQSLVWDKRRLSKPNSKAPEVSELNAERDLVQELLQGTYEQAGILEQLMARHAQMETILRQRVTELDVHLAEGAKNFEEKDARVEKASKKLQEALQVMLHFQSLCNLIRQSENLVIVPRCIPQPREYPHELNPPQTITIKPCPVCARWFYCGDWVGASCGCVYHLHCAAMWFRQSNKCCKVGCAKNMHPDWLTAWGKQWDDEALLTNLEKNLDEWRNRWKDDYKRQGKKRSRSDAFSSFDLTLELGGGFEISRSGLNTIDEPGLDDLDPKRMRVSDNSSLTCNQCMQDFVIEDIPGDTFEQEDRDNLVKHGDLTLNLLETLEEVGPANGHIPEQIDEFEHGTDIFGVSEQGRALQTGFKEMVVTPQSSQKQPQVGTEGMGTSVVGASSTGTLEEELENLSQRRVLSMEDEGIHSSDKHTAAGSPHVDRDSEVGHADNEEMHNFIVQDAPDLVIESMQEDQTKSTGQVANVQDTGHPTCVKEMMSTPQNVVESDVDDTDVHDFIVDDVRKLVGEPEHETSQEKTSDQNVDNKELQNGGKEMIATQCSGGRETATICVENTNLNLHDFLEDGSTVLSEAGHQVVNRGDQRNLPPSEIADDGNLDLRNSVKQVVATRERDSLERDNQSRDGDDTVMQDLSVDAGNETMIDRGNQLLEETEGHAAGQASLESDKVLRVCNEEVLDIQHNVERDSEVEVADKREPSLEDAELRHQTSGLGLPGRPSDFFSEKDNEFNSQAADVDHDIGRGNECGDAVDGMRCIETESQVRDAGDTAMHAVVDDGPDLAGELRHNEVRIEDERNAAANHVFSVRDAELCSVSKEVADIRRSAELENKGGDTVKVEPSIETESRLRSFGDTAMKDDGNAHASLESSERVTELQTGINQLAESQLGVEGSNAFGGANIEAPCLATESRIRNVADTPEELMGDCVSELVDESRQTSGYEDAAPSEILPETDAELQNGVRTLAESSQSVRIGIKVGTLDEEILTSPAESRPTDDASRAAVQDMDMDMAVDSASDVIAETDAGAVHHEDRGGELLGRELVAESRQTSEYEDAAPSKILPHTDAELQNGGGRLAESSQSVRIEIKVGTLDEDMLSSPAEGRPSDAVAQDMDVVVDNATDVIAATDAGAVHHEDHGGDPLDRDAEQLSGAEGFKALQGSIEPDGGGAGVLDLVVEKGYKFVGNQPLEIDGGIALKHDELIQALFEPVDETGPATPPVSESAEEPKDALTNVASSETPLEQNQDLWNVAVDLAMSQPSLERECGIQDVDNASIQEVQDVSSPVGGQSHQTKLGEEHVARDGGIAQYLLERVPSDEHVAPMIEEMCDGSSIQVASVEGAGPVKELANSFRSLEREIGVIGPSAGDGFAPEMHNIRCEVATNLQSLPSQLMSGDNVPGFGRNGNPVGFANEGSQILHTCDASGGSETLDSIALAVAPAEGRVDNVVVNGNPPANGIGGGEAEVVSGHCQAQEVCEAGDNTSAPRSPVSNVVTAEKRVDNVPPGEIARGPRMSTASITVPVIQLLSDDDDDDDVIEVAAPAQFVYRRNTVSGKAVPQRIPSEEENRRAAQPGMYTALLRAVEENPRHR